MALTVVKYTKTPSGEVIGTPAILINNTLQNIPSPQNLQQNYQSNVTPNKSRVSSDLVIKKVPVKSSKIMKRATAETKTICEPTLKSKKYTVRIAPPTGRPSTSSQGSCNKNVMNASGTLGQRQKQQLEGKQLVTNFDSFSTTIPKTPFTQPTIMTSTTAGIPTTISTTTPSKKTHLLRIRTPNELQSTHTKTSTNNNNKTNYSNNKNETFTSNNTNSAHSPIHSLPMDRPTIHIKHEKPKRTIQSVTIELIEKSPFVHLGVHLNRMPILKHVICPTVGITLFECYVTLKKLRTNESFPLLAQYFEITEVEIKQIFKSVIVKLARYMRFLIRWPEHKKHSDRHKNLPFAFRQNHLYVQSLVECIETAFTLRQWKKECNNYKYLICFDPTGIITYVSEVYVGQLDDIRIIEASNFTEFIPQSVTLMADPGKGIRRKQESIKQEEQTFTEKVDSFGPSTSLQAVSFAKSSRASGAMAIDRVPAVNIGAGSNIGVRNNTLNASSSAFGIGTAGGAVIMGNRGTVTHAVNGTVNPIAMYGTTPVASCNLYVSACSYKETIGNFNNTKQDADQDNCDNDSDDADDTDDNRTQSLSRYTASQLVGEFASQHTLTVVNNQLTSKFVDNFSIPTIHAPQNYLRSYITDMIVILREFKILRNLAIEDVILCKYLNEILVVCAALTNLQK